MGRVQELYKGDWECIGFWLLLVVGEKRYLTPVVC